MVLHPLHARHHHGPLVLALDLPISLAESGQGMRPHTACAWLLTCLSLLRELLNSTYMAGQRHGTWGWSCYTRQLVVCMAPVFYSEQTLGRGSCYRYLRCRRCGNLLLRVLSASRLQPCAGLVPPAASVFLMGRPGAILMVTMLFMAVTSAGSAELVAVSSLFTYDIYRTYINPKATGAHRRMQCTQWC